MTLKALTAQGAIVGWTCKSEALLDVLAKEQQVLAKEHQPLSKARV